MPTYPTFPAIAPTEAPAETEARVLQTNFGDGYGQTVADGIQNVRLTVNVSWLNLTDSEAQTLEDFLRARGGYLPFFWTPPRTATALKWRCQKWTRTPLECAYCNFSATFVQAFDL